MRKIKEVIVVEGKYDKNTVKQVVDAVVIETSGFSIFSNREKMELLRRLAEKRGIIILTDGDGAGFLIRNYIKGSVTGNVKQAFIPDIYGKEKRKSLPSKEGKLGVEGMRPEVILKALEKAGATFADEPAAEKISSGITKADLYEAGFSGVAGSAEKRKKLAAVMELPEKISANSMLDVINALYTREEFFELIKSPALQ